MNATMDDLQPSSPGVAIGLTFFGMLFCTIGASVPWIVQSVNRHLKKELKKGEELISHAFLAGCFGFAAGALLMGSLFDVLPASQQSFAALDNASDYWAQYSNLAAWGSFLLGIFFFLCLENIISSLAPDIDCPCHGSVKVNARTKQVDPQGEQIALKTFNVNSPKNIQLETIEITTSEKDCCVSGVCEMGLKECCCTEVRSRVKVTGVSWTVFLAMLIHHIPEGMVYYILATTNLKYGIIVGLILLLHVGPEGLALGIPAFVAYPSQPWRATLHGAIAGFGQPLGALIAYGAFSVNTPDTATLGVIEGLVAGMLTTIAVKGLIPYGLKYDQDNVYCGLSALAGASTILFSISCFGLAHFNG